jgi:hypothetical protein
MYGTLNETEKHILLRWMLYESQVNAQTYTRKIAVLLLRNLPALR